MVWQCVIYQFNGHGKTHHSFTDVRVWFYPQNYTVTEGGAVNVTLVTNTSDYEFDFNVILLFLDESATCKFCGDILGYQWPERPLGGV